MPSRKNACTEMKKARAAGKKVLAALWEFVNDIEVSGGVTELGDGNVVPHADTTWSDLGRTYLRACEALGREPKLNVYQAPDDEEPDPREQNAPDEEDRW